MALPPEDVINKRFQPTKFRDGYDQDEVDDFLDEIAAELRRLTQENEDLYKKFREAQSTIPLGTPAAPAVKNSPPALKVERGEITDDARNEHNTGGGRSHGTAAALPAATQVPGSSSSTQSAAGLLALAQQKHDRHLVDGHTYRDTILGEAKIKAISLVDDAEEKSRNILGALYQQHSEVERKIEQLRGFERDYRSGMEALIKDRLRDLDT